MSAAEVDRSGLGVDSIPGGAVASLSREWQYGGRANAFIQARMSSTRLPGKAMLPLVGKPMIWHVWNRATRCRQIEFAVVVTSVDSSDEPLIGFCGESGIPFFRGSLPKVGIWEMRG